jgi:predicted NUDIX family phosphoesterase
MKPLIFSLLVYIVLFKMTFDYHTNDLEKIIHKGLVMINENILVVKRTTLFPTQVFQGLQTQSDSFIALINQAKEFLPRPAMELDTNYKQIIPYLIFKHADRYFLMQRQATSSEQRLKNKYSLGIGGHIRQEDMHNAATIFDWAQREFHEEVDYQGNFTIKTIGILNDDSNAVGQVHLGLVLLLEGDSSAISVRSELKSGQLLTTDACKEYYADMETWSQIIFDSLLIKDR